VRHQPIGGRRASPAARAGRRADGRPHAGRRRDRGDARAGARRAPRAGADPDNLEQDDVFGALRAWASGFLVKRTRPEELVAGIHTITTGDSLLSPSVTRRVIDRIAQQPTRPRRSAGLDTLTPPERQVLELVARGLWNREIATALVVEESTVRTHIKRLLMELGLRDPRPDRDLRLRAQREPARRRSRSGTTVNISTDRATCAA
jgi:DNA-binding CsgD family transcriptional regulator